MDYDPGKLVEILSEGFDVPQTVPGPLWRRAHRWDDLIFNSPLSFHADPDRIGLNPFEWEDGILSIAPRPIPNAQREAVRAHLLDTGARPEAVDAVTHYTGLISLHDSWAETYGYVEIRARVPGYAGHWPAFWLAPGTKGWPPEIDVFEIDTRTETEPPTESFVASVHFDEIAPDGTPLHRTLDENPFAEEQTLFASRPQRPVERPNGKAPRLVLSKEIATSRDLSAHFHTYAVLWTPETITWYFGPDRASLSEVYKTPTPADLHSPLYVIANTEIGGMMAGQAGPGGIVEDALDIDHIKVMALAPARRMSGEGRIVGTRAPEWIEGSAGNDRIAPGRGLDIVTTGQGADIILLARRDGNLIVTDFGPEDRISLVGFRAKDVPTLLSMALTVGDDIWLRDPGAPFEPRTIILKGAASRGIRADQISLE